MKDSSNVLVRTLRFLATQNPALLELPAMEAEDVAQSETPESPELGAQHLDLRPWPPRRRYSSMAAPASAGYSVGNPVRAGIAIAEEYLNLAFIARSLGLEMNRVTDELKDWCPTGGPLRIPIKLVNIPPRPPRPEWLAQYQFAAVARLAMVRTDDKQLRGAIDKAVAGFTDALEHSLTEISM